MVATPDDGQYQSLRRFFAGTDWKIFRVQTIAEGLSTVINHKINIILTEHELADGSWMELIEALRPCRNAPRVLVSSSRADDRLWMDVLDGGGYDVLVTPFDRSEVLRVVQMAFMSWSKRALGFGSPWFPVEPVDIELQGAPR
jgi:DNA-binding response OmpR family regulator